MINTIINFLKPVFKWIFRFIISIIISNIVMWLLRYSLSSFIEKFETKITNWLNEKTTYITNNILKLNEWLNEISNTIFNKVDEYINDVEEYILEQLNNIEAAVDEIIPDINTSELAQDILNQVSSTIADAVEQVVSIINLESIKNLIADAVNQADSFKQDAKAKAVQFWDSLISPVQAQITLADNLFFTAVETINTPVESCNSSINEIQSSLVAGCNELENYNNSLENKKSAVLNLIASGGQITQEQIENILEISTPSALTLNFGQYRTNPPEFDRKDYLLNLTLQPFEELNIIDFSSFLSNLTAVNTQWQNISAELNTLAQDALQRVESALSILDIKGTLEDKIKNLIVIALAQAVYQLKTDLLNKVDSKIQAVQTAKEEDKQEIVNDKQAVVEALKEYEQSLYDKIEPILSPTVQEMIQDLSEGINKDENEIQVNIDDILPDTTELDHILETFPNLNADAAPNISDSKIFTIGDIYRILCSYFSRSERAALILLLFEQDLHLNESKIEQLQLTWNNESNPDQAIA